MEIRNIIFDWSGVISDDIMQVYNTTNQVFQLHEHRPISLEEFKRTAYVPASKQWQQYLSNVPIQTIQKDFNSLFPLQKKPRSFPWVKETLEYLLSKNLKLHVLSAHPMYFLESEARYNGIDKYFQNLHGGYYYKERFLVNLARNNEMNRDNTLYVEDMADNIMAGRKAGIRTAAVLSGYHDEARLRKAEPDHLLKNISELKTILTAQSQTPQYQI